MLVLFTVFQCCKQTVVSIDGCVLFEIIFYLLPFDWTWFIQQLTDVVPDLHSVCLFVCYLFLPCDYCISTSTTLFTILSILVWNIYFEYCFYRLILDEFAVCTVINMFGFMLSFLVFKLFLVVYICEWYTADLLTCWSPEMIT